MIHKQKEPITKEIYTRRKDEAHPVTSLTTPLSHQFKYP